MIMMDKVTGKKRILIVDDDPNVTQMLATLLQMKGYEVDVAATGQEAIKKASSSNVELILLDLILPDLEGFEVCRYLKGEKATLHIPVIIVSARYLFEDKVEGLHLGADDYVTKPFENEELFARMEAVMRRRLFFNLDQSKDGKEKIILELRKIIDQELIESFFQPIYLLKPFKLLGLEVLTRPLTQTILSNPELLFKAALQFGFYCDLEMLAWKKALRFISQHPLSEAKIFLNCNPYLVEGHKFLKIKSVFDENHIDVEKVVLEITERSAIKDFKTFYEHLKYFKDQGFGVAVDDVGGGYASLESIVETQPDVVKIDRHIISDLKRDIFRRSIVKFIVSFCKENQIISVAEGIETRRDLDAVIDLGVDAGQGYFLYRPTTQINLKDISQKSLSKN